MKKIALNLLSLAVATTLFVGCSTDTLTEENSSLNATATVFEGQDIQQNQLVGTWIIESMTSNIAVDLDANGSSSVDLLTETTCFDGMYFDFNAEGIVETEQGRISILEDRVECDGSGVYTAGYEVSGNTLSVTAEINGQTVTLTKTIGLSSDASGEYLHVAIEDYEVEQIVSDPGNTVASDIERIEIVYKKQ
ncbi:lipocalin family protein [Salinimicrobium catena]|uniref:lipocalin family protein n=1 Tax=Salinimicrobium catena TaxID=390640 RepID=UPI002FE4B5E5